ncbi:MAG: carboxypeptidase M32 [Alphaproteobacteria bacterium]|nr:carboxypeptidase M32 [Alphaproteobacteria bacterium]
MSAYQKLEAHFRRAAHLDDAVSMLHWDMSTMMPAGGAEARAEQMATLRGIRHHLIASSETADLLAAATDNGAVGGLNDWQSANLAEMRRDHIHAAAVEDELIEALSKACSACEMVWREARPESDFAKVLPSLKTVLALYQQVAAAKSEAFGCSPYEALLDQWEPGGKTATIDTIFDDLADFLPPFIDQALAAQAKRPAAIVPEGPFPAEKQKSLATKLMDVLGFEFERGRLDVSFHPFCGGATDDVRITTRWDEADFVEGLMAVLHETGHALYELGLPSDWRHQPVGKARGMTLHESQSLLMEMQACRTHEFLSFAAPLIREAFGGSGPAFETENLYRHYTHVERSFIRTEADEVTYPTHVILRYRLERAMLAGELDLADLPEAFNDGLEALLGIRPPDDRQGCLQDIHWYAGAWGYFPTYTLGAIAAAQFFDAAKRDDPAIVPGIAKGDFAPLVGWLRAHVHGLGSKLTTDALVEQATGRPLDPAVFKAHLKARYLD